MFTGMNEQIKIFENQQFGKIRTSGTPDEPLFCLADVCRVLEINNPSDVKKRLKQDGVDSIEVGVQTGVKSDGTPIYQTVKAMFVNEQNLYRVIMRSDKPQAEPFQDWVCGEVLPTIRKHGAYMTDDIIERTLTDPDYLIRLATELKNEKQKRLLAENDAKLKQRQLTEQQPKVEFYDAVTQSEGSESFEDVAQTLKSKVLRVPDFGQKKLTEILREMKIIFGKGNNLRAYQEYLNRGYFEAINYPFKDKNGRPHIGHKTLITQRGKQFVAKVVKQYYYDINPNKPRQLFLFDIQGNK